MFKGIFGDLEKEIRDRDSFPGKTLEGIPFLGFNSLSNHKKWKSQDPT
jgi:hypothetical protein